MATHGMGMVFLTGIGATIVADLWSLVRKRLFAVPAPNYGLVGRWIAHMPRGRIHHPSIAAAPPMHGEVAIGWITHYLIGIAFACLLPAFWGFAWFRHPTLTPALLVGIGTVVAPWFVMQPAMGAGIAASRTPHPASARVHSVVFHAMYGLGLYIAARLVSDLTAS